MRFQEDRIFIPASLRSIILDELHGTQDEITRCCVYWPNIECDIDRMVNGSEMFALTESNTPKAPGHSWDPPEENWERIYIDYAGSFEDRYSLPRLEFENQ
ncbi:hypothetical protein JTB14_029311 [Gonioctena quinquepunctata]|nr:hypothetical protein JTB14_029311 [Gonioctena quinquepunctata]